MGRSSQNCVNAHRTKSLPGHGLMCVPHGHTVEHITVQSAGGALSHRNEILCPTRGLSHLFSVSTTAVQDLVCFKSQDIAYELGNTRRSCTACCAEC